MLYALHYEQKPGSKLSSIISALRDRGVSDDMISVIQKFLKWEWKRSSSADSRPPRAARATSTGSSGLGGLVSGIAKSIKGNNSIYTQHQPLLRTSSRR